MLLCWCWSSRGILLLLEGPLQWSSGVLVLVVEWKSYCWWIAGVGGGVVY